MTRRPTIRWGPISCATPGSDHRCAEGHGVGGDPARAPLLRMLVRAASSTTGRRSCTDCRISLVCHVRSSKVDNLVINITNRGEPGGVALHDQGCKN
jgi:hypothetical protein